MKTTKIKKSVWVPLALAVYAAAMSCFYGPDLISEGRALKFWISVAVEALVVIGVFFALRHKEKLSSRWPKR